MESTDERKLFEEDDPNLGVKFRELARIRIENSDLTRESLENNRFFRDLIRRLI